MQINIQTKFSKEEVERLDTACLRAHVTRYEFLRKAVMEKVERDRKTS